MKHYARNIFRFNFRNDDVCFFVWIYETEQFKLKVGRCFALNSNHLGGFDLFVTGRRHFLLSERSLSFNNVMITLTSARPSAQTVELASGMHIWNIKALGPIDQKLVSMLKFVAHTGTVTHTHTHTCTCTQTQNNMSSGRRYWALKNELSLQ